MKKEKVRCIEYKQTWGSEGWRDRIDRNLERMHLFVTIVVSHPSVIHLFVTIAVSHPSTPSVACM